MEGVLFPIESLRNELANPNSAIWVPGQYHSGASVEHTFYKNPLFKYCGANFF